MEEIVNFVVKRVPQLNLYIILETFILILPLIVGLPIALIEKRYTDIGIGLSIYVVICIVIMAQFVIFRRYYWGKVFLNDEGVGYKYHKIPYKFFKWEDIIKVKICQSSFTFFIAEELKRGKNVVQMNFQLTYRNHRKTINTCKEICKVISFKQKKHNFEIYYANDNIKKCLSET